MGRDYLFTWKLNHWPHSELQRLVAKFESGQPAVEPWRCQSHRKIKIGDRAYFMKLGDSPRGIFGVGTILGPPIENKKASAGENRWQVPITFDVLVDPTKSILVPESKLLTLKAPDHRWHPQGSGVTLEAEAARAIDALLDSRIDSRKVLSTERDRQDSKIEQELRALIPKKVLTPVVRMLAASIAKANESNPGKWGIRIDKQSIMLKVGFPEVLQVGNGWVHWLVSNELTPAKIREEKRFEFSKTPYKNAPQCDTCDVELENLEELQSRLLPAHEAAIEIASRSPLSVSTSANHSTELVDLISKLSGTNLPQPTYVKETEPYLYPDEQETFLEGAATRILVNRYERDAAVRDKCVKHHGTDCKACGVSFGNRYGPSVKGFIHVYHLKPLGDVRKQKTVDPILDLQPVCPNCHAVIHSKKPPLSIDQVKSLIQKHEKPRAID